MTESLETPVFVVVGNVNQGKSSIVATLAETTNVPIATHPGTTVRSGEYVFRSGDRPLFRLIDTPGFQEARAALAWMEERSFSAADHPDVVAAFVKEHDQGERFEDEVRLLRPILNGAGILYVVDASSRFQPSHEAEMEILRWTGQTGMALINRTQDRDHADEWRPILEQFFNVVRVFNAHEAGFDDRMSLLRSFREIRDDWRDAMDRAIGVMERDWATRRRRTAQVIAELMVNALSHVERRRLGEHDREDALRPDLEVAYKKAQRGFEESARAEVEALFRHGALRRAEVAPELHDEDLFSDTAWLAFGLTRTQLAQYGAGWGALIGGAIDLMVGGLSFFAGAAIGAVAGGAAGFFGGTRIARTWGDRSKMAQILFPGDNGHFLCMGPVTNPRFAWVLLDRAFVHALHIRDRSHARQEPMDLSRGDSKGKAGITASLDATLRGALDGALQKVLKGALKGQVSPAAHERLTELIDEVLGMGLTLARSG